jgi:hypothetical protein
MLRADIGAPWFSNVIEMGAKDTFRRFLHIGRESDAIQRL